MENYFSSVYLLCVFVDELPLMTILDTGYSEKVSLHCVSSCVYADQVAVTSTFDKGHKEKVLSSVALF